MNPGSKSPSFSTQLKLEPVNNFGYQTAVKGSQMLKRKSLSEKVLSESQSPKDERIKIRQPRRNAQLQLLLCQLHFGSLG